MEEELYGFYQFPGSKNHWEEKYFLNFLVSRNVFIKGNFCQFIASKIYDKIWHYFNIFHNFYVSKFFGMSPVCRLEAVKVAFIVDTYVNITKSIRRNISEITSKRFLKILLNSWSLALGMLRMTHLNSHCHTQK